MALQPSLYLTWEDLSGANPTEDEIFQDLRELDRLHTLILLARVNAHLFLDNFHRKADETNAVQRFLLAAFLDDSNIEKAKEKFGRDRLDFRRAFHQQQTLTLMKRAFREGSRSGARPDTDEQSRHALGRCLIKTSDRLFPAEMRSAFERWRRAPTTNKFLTMQLNAGSGFEVNNPPAIPSSIVRSDILFGEVLRNLNLSFDVRGQFKRQTGLELDTYLDMIFGLLVHYVSKTQQQLREDPGLVIINPKTFFGQNLTAEQARKFWTMEAASIDEIAADLEKPSGLIFHQDFTVFRMKPFVQISDEALACVNPTFVQEKLEAGLFWSITNHLDTIDERKRMFDAWGHCFESYVNHLLSTSVDADLERYMGFPQFEGKKHHHESFDAIVISGPKCVVIECKGGFLSAKAKYSEDRKSLLEDLDLKFGSQPSGGVEQLARKIEQTFHAKDTGRRKIKDLEPREIQVLIPVLMVQDSFVSSPFTVPWLAKVFRDCMRKKSLLRNIVCVGLVVADVGELEAIRPYLISKKLSLTEVLMNRARKGDPGSDNRIFTFHDTVNSLLEENEINEVPRSDFDDRFDAIVNRVCLRFFGRPFERLGSEEKQADG